MAIARVALPVAAWHLFDYWIPEGLKVAAGDVVRVRLAGRRQAGVVTAVDATSAFLDRLQPIESIVDTPRLPAEILQLAAFTSAYYQASPGMAYALATPPLTRARRPKVSPDVAAIADPDVHASHRLNAEQASAATAIVAADFFDPHLGAGEREAPECGQCGIGDFRQPALQLFGAGVVRRVDQDPQLGIAGA